MLKLLLFAILLYFILRVSARLLLTIRSDAGQRPPRSFREEARRRASEPRATRDEPPMDIEDAKWEDL